MAANSERSRLRYAGRIPQETLDYLELKKQQARRLRWWDIPVLFTQVFLLTLLVMVHFRSHTHSLSIDLLLLCVLIVTLAQILWRLTRIYVATL